MTLGGHRVASGDICVCLNWGCSRRGVGGAGVLLSPLRWPGRPRRVTCPHVEWGFTSASATRHCTLRDRDRGPASLSAPGDIREGASGLASVSAVLGGSGRLGWHTQHRTRGAERIPQPRAEARPPPPPGS